MSDQKILQLQSETGCDFDLAKLMLKFTGDDVEGAVKIISSVEKNIYVIRGKFIAQTNKIYGAFIFFYDVKNKSIEKVNAVIRDNDKSAIEFDFEKRWKEYQEDLLNYEKSRGINLNLQNNFYTGLINSKSVHFFERLSSCSCAVVNAGIFFLMYSVSTNAYFCATAMADVRSSSPIIKLVFFMTVIINILLKLLTYNKMEL